MLHSLLFFAELVAFMTLVVWTCRFETTGSLDKGPFGMREETAETPAPRERTPGWKRAVAQDQAAAPEQAVRQGATPAWRRTLRYDRQRWRV